MSDDYLFSADVVFDHTQTNHDTVFGISHYSKKKNEVGEQKESEARFEEDLRMTKKGKNESRGD